MNPALQPLILIAAVIFGIYSGRAKAERLRSMAKTLKVYPRNQRWWTGPLIGIAFFGAIFLYAHIVVG